MVAHQGPRFGIPLGLEAGQAVVAPLHLAEVIELALRNDGAAAGGDDAAKGGDYPESKYTAERGADSPLTTTEVALLVAAGALAGGGAAWLLRRLTKSR